MSNPSRPFRSSDDRPIGTVGNSIPPLNAGDDDIDMSITHRMVLSMISMGCALYLVLFIGYWPVVAFGGLAFASVAVFWRRPAAFYFAMIIWLGGALLPSTRVGEVFQPSGLAGNLIYLFQSPIQQRSDYFDGFDIIRAAVILLYAISTLRYLEIAQREDFHAAILKSMDGSASTRKNSVKSYRISPLSGIAIAVAIAILIACLILYGFSYQAVRMNLISSGLGRQVRYGSGLATPEARSLLLVWIYVGVGLVGSSIIGFVEWRRLSTLQARVYCVRETYQELGAELSLIESQRAKRRLRGLKRG